MLNRFKFQIMVGGDEGGGGGRVMLHSFASGVTPNVRASQGAMEYKKRAKNTNYIFCERLPQPVEAQTIIDLHVVCVLQISVSPIHR